MAQRFAELQETVRNNYKYCVVFAQSNNCGAEKQPLLGNALRNNRRGVMIRDSYSRCYGSPAAYACAVTPRSNGRE
jgi:hypothetical protein